MRAFLFAVAVCCTLGVAVVADWAYRHAPVRQYGAGRPAGAWGTHACSRVGVRACGVPMSPVTREGYEWVRDRNKLGCKDWVEDDRCGCGFSLQARDADGDGDEMRSVVAWGPNALLSFRPRCCCAGACVRRFDCRPLFA